MIGPLPEVVGLAEPQVGLPNVRKAIQLGFDRATLQKVRYDEMKWEADLPGSVALYEFQDGYRDTYSEIGGGYDVEQAKTLLDEAGWTAGDDGIREKDGERFELLWPVIGDAATSKNVSVASQAMLKEIGVDLKLDYRSADAFT